MMLDNLANKVNVLCQKIKNLANKNCHAFAAIEDEISNDDIIDASQSTPLILPGLILAERKCFQLIIISVSFISDETTIVRDWPILKYTGKKKGKFLLSVASTVELLMEGLITTIDVFFAIGKNGGVPVIVEPRLIKEYMVLDADNSPQSTEAMDGIVELEPGDTIGFFFTSTATIGSGGILVKNFMQSLIQIE